MAKVRISNRGEQWRADMDETRENLPSLVWRRIFRLFRIDIKDPRQATGAQVGKLLKDLMGTRDSDEIDVSREELELFVDALVPSLFDLR